MNLLKRPVLGLAVVALLATTFLSSGAGASGTSGVTYATQQVTKYSVRPTKIMIAKPLGAAVPKDKSVLFISCGVPACNLEGSIIKGVISHFGGWKFTQITTSGTPQSDLAAWQSAVREKPSAVLYTGTNDTAFLSELKQLKADGTAVAGCCTTDSPPAPTNFNVYTVHQLEPVGKLMADWVTSESNGSGDALQVTVPAFPTLIGFIQGYNAEIKKVCSGCTTHLLSVSYTDLAAGNAPADIVSYLRANPGIKYLVLNLDSSLAVGLPAALSAAGIAGVKIIGTGPSQVNLQYIKEGEEAATIPFPYYELLGGAMIDGILRAIDHKPAINGTKLVMPLWVVTAKNLPSTNIFPIVANEQSQWFKLWGVR